MSNVTHHLTDALLMSYASGTLEEAFSLVVASHISLCDECRARLESYEAVGGALIDETSEQAAVSEDALEAVMAKIDAAPVIEVSRPRADRIFPVPLQDYVGGDLDDVRWRPVGGGVRQAVLKMRDATKVRLLSIPGGAESLVRETLA